MAAGARTEVAANLRVRMAVRIAQATQARHATHKLVQVQAVGVNVLHLCRFWYCISNGFTDGLTKDVMGACAHLFITLQTALPAALNWTADGPISGRAQKLVTVGLRPEIAAILRMQMAARVV